MGGIPAATITRMHSEWATTACCGMQAETSPLNSSIVGHTHGFLACTSTMRTERQIRDRPEIQVGRGHGPSTSGAANLTYVPHGELLPGSDQRVFRVFRRSGHIVLASFAGCSDAAVRIPRIVSTTRRSRINVPAAGRFG